MYDEWKYFTSEFPMVKRNEYFKRIRYLPSTALNSTNQQKYRNIRIAKAG